MLSDFVQPTEYVIRKMALIIETRLSLIALHLLKYFAEGICRISCLSVIAIFAACCQHADAAIFSAEEFGARGDGMADDTAAINRLLRRCSDTTNSRCELKANRRYLIRSPIFIWGRTTLTSSAGGRAKLLFDVDSAPYLVNLGLSAFHRPATPFGGKIERLDFEIIGGKSGRLIYFWRVDGAVLAGNSFDMGAFGYSATSSGNDNRWLINSKRWVVRSNLIIRDNKIVAHSNNIGSEGIGVSGFRGVAIENNEVVGVGDDPVGVHDCELVTIRKNYLKSNDGRILVNNSTFVDISDNRVERMIPAPDGRIYGGIALIYVGYESYASGSLVKQRPPQEITISKNTLIYPEHSIDRGSAIYVYGAINARVMTNEIINESESVVASAIHVLPARERGNIAKKTVVNGIHNGMVRGAKIYGNKAVTRIPMSMKMTGNCSEYDGDVEVSENIAGEFEFYCDFVRQKNNVTMPAGK